MLNNNTNKLFKIIGGAMYQIRQNKTLDLPKHNDLQGGIKPPVPHFGTNKVHKNNEANS